MYNTFVLHLQKLAQRGDSCASFCRSEVHVHVHVRVRVYLPQQCTAWMNSWSPCNWHPWFLFLWEWTRSVWLKILECRLRTCLRHVTAAYIIKASHPWECSAFACNPLLDRLYNVFRAPILLLSALEWLGRVADKHLGWWCCKNWTCPFDSSHCYKYSVVWHHTSVLSVPL